MIGDQTACKPGSVPPGAAKPRTLAIIPLDRPSRDGSRDLPGPLRPTTALPSFAEATEGGLLSVALSLGSPPAGVTRRHVVVEPGLSSTPLRKPRPPSRLIRAEPDRLDAPGQGNEVVHEPHQPHERFALPRLRGSGGSVLGTTENTEGAQNRRRLLP